MEAQLRWRIWKHVLLFAVGTLAGSFIWLPLGLAASWLAIPEASEDRSILKYGGTALLLNCLVFGTIFFSIAAAVAKRFLAEPVLWSSAVSGAIYSAVAFTSALYMPIARGSPGGILFAAWLILFPALAVAASSLFLKRRPTPS